MKRIQNMRDFIYVFIKKEQKKRNLYLRVYRKLTIKCENIYLIICSVCVFECDALRGYANLRSQFAQGNKSPPGGDYITRLLPNGSCE